MLNKLQYILTILGWAAYAHQSTPPLLIEVHVQSRWALLIVARLFDHTAKKNCCFFTYQDTLKILDYLRLHNFTLLGALILLFLRNTGTAVFMQSNSWPGWRAEQKCTPLIHVDIKIFCFVLFFHAYCRFSEWMHKPNKFERHPAPYSPHWKSCSGSVRAAQTPVGAKVNYVHVRIAMTC